MASQIVTNAPAAVACAAAGQFQSWLAQAGGAIAVSTYQAGKVAMIGWDGRQVTLLMREFDKPLGLTTSDGRIVLATRHDLMVLSNAASLASDYLPDQPGRYDALYMPRAAYHVGDVNVHDVAMVGNEIWLAVTRFCCLAKLSFDFSFQPVWRPWFLTDLVPEDRCHLNGIAIRDGRPRYMTALGTTDTPGAWRENKATGGVLLDIERNEFVLEGLCMPHSPRWHNDRLWFLNSGAGELRVTDPGSGQSDVVCRLPGYLRGLCFLGPYALIGLSRIREKHLFGGLPVQQQHERLRCGVAVVDLRDGSETCFFEFTAGCEELYDVQFLPGVQRPTILNMEKPSVRLAVTNPDSSFWFRPTGDSADLSPAAPASSPGQDSFAPHSEIT